MAETDATNTALKEAFDILGMQHLIGFREGVELALLLLDGTDQAKVKEQLEYVLVVSAEKRHDQMAKSFGISFKQLIPVP